MANQVEMRFVSMADNLVLGRLMAAQMAAQAGFSLSAIEEIKVAVSEAVSNAIIHGYSGRQDGWIALDCKIEGKELAIAVEDWGVGIADVAQARQPEFSSDPERMGLGFVFMESFMDQVTVRSHMGHGTRVEMTRAVAEEALTGDAQ